MATSHARSISLPSRSNPKILQIQQLLFRLRPVDNVAPLSLSETSAKIDSLLDLLENFDEFLLLQQTKQALCNEKLGDELLDGLVLLLDVCGVAKDVLSQSKQHIRGLRSMFRRRKADDFEVAKEIINYLAFRKKAKKSIHKVLKGLKTKCSLDKGDEYTINMTDMSRQIQQVGLTTLKSLLFYISGLKTQSKVSRWNLVSNLIGPKRVERSEFEKVDATLNMLLDDKAKNCCDPRFMNLQTELGKLELSFEDLEQELECLNRDLIRVRVTLLNIFNH